MSQRRFYNEGQADSPMSQEDEKESKYYLKKLLEIGKKKKDTSLKKELFKDKKYKEHKGKQLTHEYEYITDLIKVLVKEHSYDTCIFWGDRFLQCCDHCDKRTKRNVLSTLMLCHQSIGNHEMVLKFGRDAIAIPLDPLDIELATVQSDLFDFYEERLVSDIRNPHPDLCAMTDHKILYHLAQSSKLLGKLDDSICYLKKRVKSCVKAYSKGQIDQLALLTSYENLIESQTVNKLYAEASDTFLKIKIYHLDTIYFGFDILEYYKEMADDAIDLYHQDNRGTEQYKYGKLPYQGRTISIAQTIYKIAKISQWKCEIFKGLNDPIRCGHCAPVPYVLFFVLGKLTNMTDHIALWEDILIRYHSYIT